LFPENVQRGFRRSGEARTCDAQTTRLIREMLNVAHWHCLESGEMVSSPFRIVQCKTKMQERQHLARAAMVGDALAEAAGQRILYAVR